MRDPNGIVGTTIDRRYAVRRFVAEGGFGAVYEAEAIALGVRVAIKLLRSEILASSPEARARFAQEARVLARLRHPGIVSITDSSHLDDGTPYLALEWIDGETLDVYLERVGALPLDDALALLGPVARAIAHAHEQQIIHRDLKPSNVMIGPSGAKVLDFGLARWAAPDGVRTSTQSGTGLSIGFAAPEQYGKEFGPVDARADQFALAAITWATLTARPPFAGDSLTQVMWATCMSKERPSVLADRPDLPRAVDEVLQRALAINPEGRYGSILELWSALEEAARSSEGAPRTVVQGPPTRTAGAFPENATLPSPNLRDGAPRTAVSPSIEVARTQPAPMTGPTGTEPTGAPRSEPPVSAAPSTRASSTTRWVLIIAVVAALVGAAFAAWPLIMPAEHPQKPKPSVSASAPPKPSASSSSAPTLPCGAIGEDEACITGGKLRRGPPDCSVYDPAHRAACPVDFVDVATFVIDRYEVSVERYSKCAAAGKCRAVEVDGPKLPMRSVTQADAAAFCAYDKKRLPTDDEWELAAAGLIHREYPWGNNLPKKGLAIFSDESATPSAPSAVDAPNAPTPEGVAHLAGNVAEWTATTAPDKAPWPLGLEASGEAAARVWVRGGSFDATLDALRTWSREAYPREHTSPSIGFRCARSRAPAK